MVPGRVRFGWRAMFPMMLAFVSGYAVYALEFSHLADGLVDLAVPVVFFLGGCFVAMAAWLSRHTVESILRAEKVEAESLLLEPRGFRRSRRTRQHALASHHAQLRR